VATGLPHAVPAIIPATSATPAATDNRFPIADNHPRFLLPVCCLMIFVSCLGFVLIINMGIVWHFPAGMSLDRSADLLQNSAKGGDRGREGAGVKFRDLNTQQLRLSCVRLISKI
jgi:hypothetical protein